MEVITYFFGSFWRWLGATITLWVIFGGTKSLFSAIVVKTVERLKGATK